MLKQGESLKENEIDPFNIKNSPTYVLVYELNLKTIVLMLLYITIV